MKLENIVEKLSWPINNPYARIMANTASYQIGVYLLLHNFISEELALATGGVIGINLSLFYEAYMLKKGLIKSSERENHGR